MIIYVVTRGSYSDYCIEAIFSKREDAQNYINETNKTDHYDLANIEEWPIDDTKNIDIVARDSWICSLGVDTGLFGEIKKELSIGKLTDKEGKSYQPQAIHSYVSAISFVSEEHAKKLCVEKRQQVLRLRAGV